MISWFRAVAGVAVCWASSIIWAYGVGVLQPLAEPGSRWWTDADPQNNTYWPRDIRDAAIVAGVTALLVLARGNLARLLIASGTGVAWVAADIVLDRLDPGRPAMTGAAVTAGVVLTLLGAAFALFPGTPWRYRPRAALLTVMLPFTGLLLAANISCPDDNIPQVPHARIAAVLVCAGALLLAATSAATGPRQLAVATVAVLAAGTGAISDPGSSGTPWGELAALAMSGVLYVTSRPWRGRNLAVTAVIVVPVAVIGSVLIGFMTFVPLVSGWLTALAGNQPVQSADTDICLAVASVACALIVGLPAGLLRRTGDVVEARPAT